MDRGRRKVLKGIGAMAGGAAVVTLPYPVLASADGHGDDDHPASSRVRRWAMVIDLRQCDGCAGLSIPPQCTQFCNWGRLVPEGDSWIEVFETSSGDLPGDGARFQEHGDGFMPALCMHCENAPCANVCPVGATFHTPNGTVLIDQERCIGCRLCIAACPYDRRFFNWGEPDQPEWVKSAPYNVFSQLPAMRGTVMKCDFCTDRAAAGGLPMCVEGCPRGAMYFGDLEEDIASNGREVVSLSHFLEENNAYRYKEDLGTSPRVWYIPGHGENASTDTSSPGFEKQNVEWIGKRMAEWETTHPAPSVEGASGG